MPLCALFSLLPAPPSCASAVCKQCKLTPITPNYAGGWLLGSHDRKGKGANKCIMHDCDLLARLQIFLFAPRLAQKMERGWPKKCRGGSGKYGYLSSPSTKGANDALMPPIQSGTITAWRFLVIAIIANAINFTSRKTDYFDTVAVEFSSVAGPCLQIWLLTYCCSPHSCMHLSSYTKVAQMPVFTHHMSFLASKLTKCRKRTHCHCRALDDLTCVISSFFQACWRSKN